jgi:nicotinate-nucleotide--dimethylbenzimidazole phosphoribosyltransferase
VAEFIFAGHLSREEGHRVLLDYMGLTPILNLGMRLGEGTGAALAAQILRTAARTHAGMATFGEAGVDGKSED